MWLNWLSVFGSDHDSGKRTTIRDIGYILFERQYTEDCDEPHAFALRGMKVLSWRGSVAVLLLREPVAVLL